MEFSLKDVQERTLAAIKPDGIEEVVDRIEASIYERASKGFFTHNFEVNDIETARYISYYLSVKGFRVARYSERIKGRGEWHRIEAIWLPAVHIGGEK